jgi:hypothetical protein
VDFCKASPLVKVPTDECWVDRLDVFANYLSVGMVMVE